MTNPFSMTFGKEPISFINRDIQTDEIIDTFTSENPAYQVCMITGIRGSGKTVTMTSIANRLQTKPDWIVVNLNPERDMLSQWVAELSNRRSLRQTFQDAKINLSFLGFGLEIDGEPPITDIVVALRQMLEQLTKKGKRILVTIDEVSSTKAVRELASQFQIFMRENLSVFLLMTGLYKNISDLQNNKNLTFLYRAPKIHLSPLPTLPMAEQYQKVFQLEWKEAVEMAECVKGYSFAYQVLGYLCWTHDKKWNELIEIFDSYMSEYSYNKIWSELSAQDRRLLKCVALLPPMPKTSEVRESAKVSSNLFNVYRKRWIDMGIIESNTHGYISFTLPRFREYILDNQIVE